jgi:hypothetical protein
MAKAFASAIIDAPIEAVWSVVRDFNGMPNWNPGVADSAIEAGLPSDAVGCIRTFHLRDGTHVRERLLSLDDSRYTFSYNFETPAFPVENYVADFELIPVTDGDRTYAQWTATFDEAPADKGKYVAIVSNDVFAGGLKALAAKTVGRKAPDGAVRWQGLRPAKVFCSSILHAGVSEAWAKLRDFAGMAGWHPEIHDMHMMAGARSDQIGGVRDFMFGTGQLHEQLTYLSDTEWAFRYKINSSGNPWMNYHAGARLYPIAATGESFAVWTADWVASANDDVTLIPLVHNGVFQLAFDTLNERFFKKR